MSKKTSKTSREPKAVYTDRAGRKLFVSESTGPRQVVRAGQVQRAFLQGKGLATISESARAFLSLPLLNGVVDDIDLPLAYLALPKRFAMDGSEWMFWARPDGSPDCRELAGRSSLHCAGVVKWCDYQTAREQVEAWIREQGVYPAMGVADHLGLLLSDLREWHKANVDGFMAAHVTGSQRLTALPISAYARRESGKCIVEVIAAESGAQASEISGEDTPEDAPVDLAPAWAAGLEGALAGSVAPRDIGRDAAAVQQLLTLLRPSTASSNPVFQRSGLKRSLKTYPALAAGAGEIPHLLHCFALDLLESDSANKRPYAPGTPYTYLKSFALDFVSVFQGLTLGDIEPENYERAMKQVVASGPTSAPRMAALRAFHRFLFVWWDVPRLKKEILGEGDDERVDANIVWDHELARIHRWIAEAKAGAASPDRILDELPVAFAIASQIELRIADLLALRIKNIADDTDHLVVEVARDLKDGSAKTRAGRRREVITDPRSVTIIRAWIRKRLDPDQDGASRRDYLFGDTNAPNQLFRRGKLYFAINRLLKEATGDRSIGSHALRHTGTSKKLGHAWENPTLQGEVLATDQIAVDAGHETSSTSAKFYGHLYAHALRLAIDDALFGDLDAADVASFLGARNSGALRARLSRKLRGLPDDLPDGTVEKLRVDLERRRRKVEVFRDALRAPLVERSVTHDLNFYEPANPMTALVSAQPLSLRSLLHSLHDLSRGISPESVCSRQDLAEVQLAGVLREVELFARLSGQFSTRLLDRADVALELLRESDQAHLGFRADFAGALRHGHLKALLQGAQAAPLSLVAAAATYWQEQLSEGELVIDANRIGFSKLLEILKETGFSAAHVGIRAEVRVDPTTTGAPQDCADATEDPESGKQVDHGRSAEELQIVDPNAWEAASQFESVFRRSPEMFPLRVNHERSRVTLCVASDPQYLGKRGRGASPTSFHSLMFAIYIWTRLSKQD